MSKLLQQAMNLKEVQELARQQDNNGRVSFIVKVELIDLIDKTLGELNEHIDTLASTNFEWIPTDIYYRSFGVVQGQKTGSIVTGDVLLEVDCIPESVD